jgi:hypothetical protein
VKRVRSSKQLVFGRSFEGLKGDDRNYFEILQEYTHLADIHWRSEQRAYCRFIERGDFDPVVSITWGQRRQGVTLVSFKRELLEYYLAASSSALVRMFDFTLFRYGDFIGWPAGSERTSRDEWAEAFMDLSKLIIEGFEVKAIRARLTDAGIGFDQKDQSLALLERLLAAEPTNSGQEKLTGLRTVQEIRSRVKGHSVGRKATELAHNALKQHETFAAHFGHVCRLVAEELKRIERLFS